MALLQKGVAATTHRMPKMISPGGHAVADYANVAAFVLMGVLFRKRNSRAAVAAFLAAGIQAATALMTDYPGGVAHVMDFSTHATIDRGFSVALFAMPDMLRFNDSSKAKYFRLMSLNLTAVTGLTDFEEGSQAWERREAA